MFPPDVEKILYVPAGDAAAMPGVKVVAGWREICDYFFPSSGPEPSMETIGRIAAGLAERDVAAVEPIAGGRNGRVYRVTAGDGARYALKAYFRHWKDDCDRLAAEFDGLSFLWDHGVRDVPRPIASAREAGYALYEYVEGEPASVARVTASDVDAAVGFLAGLRRLRDAPGSGALPAASEACFSGRALEVNLRARLRRLEGSNGQPTDPGLRAFLTDEFVPALDALVAWSQAQLDFERELARAERTLSPSDFGFHNALRRGGRLVFLDFEYFGWDDPAKMAADFLLHPAMELPAELKRRFVAGVLARFADDAGLARRVRALYPLFGLKWCLILLNEFMSEDLSRRRFAGVVDCPALRIEQLGKARRILHQVLDEYQRFAYAG
jgi:hypothetical protein